MSRVLSNVGRLCERELLRDPRPERDVIPDDSESGLKPLFVAVGDRSVLSGEAG